MASHDIIWVSGAHMRFGDLDFIVMLGGELALAHVAIQPLPSIGFDYGRLEHQLGASLGPQPSREDPRCLTFSYANDMAWLAGGEPLSPEHLIRSTPIVLSFGLHNTAVTISHLVAQRMVLPPANNEFVGVIKHIMESLHNLLAKELGHPLALTLAGGAITPPGNAS